VAGLLQIGPRIRVRGLRPIGLHADVAVAAGRQLRRDREVPEKPVHTVFGRIERRDRLLDDLFVGTGADRDHQHPEKIDQQTIELHCSSERGTAMIKVAL